MSAKDVSTACFWLLVGYLIFTALFGVGKGGYAPEHWFWWIVFGFLVIVGAMATMFRFSPKSDEEDDEKVSRR